jgi:hypothetical protein
MPGFSELDRLSGREERWEDQERGDWNMGRMSKEFEERLYSEHGRAILEAQRWPVTCDGKGNLERYIDVDLTEPYPCPGCEECKPEPIEAEIIDALRGLASKYDEHLAKAGVDVRRADTTRRGLSSERRYDHLRWMLAEMVKLTDAGKFNRWLGFVQGALWFGGVFTVDQMREHVREALR